MLVEYFGGFRLAGKEADEGGEVVDGFHFLVLSCVVPIFLIDVFNIS